MRSVILLAPDGRTLFLITTFFFVVVVVVIPTSTSTTRVGKSDHQQSSLITGYPRYYHDGTKRGARGRGESDETNNESRPSRTILSSRHKMQRDEIPTQRDSKNTYWFLVRRVWCLLSKISTLALSWFPRDECVYSNVTVHYIRFESRVISFFIDLVTFFSKGSMRLSGLLGAGKINYEESPQRHSRNMG